MRHNKRYLMKLVALLMIVCVALSATIFTSGVVLADEAVSEATDDDWDSEDEDWDEEDEDWDDEDWDEEEWGIDPVVNFYASSVGKTSVKLKWDKVEDVDGYELMYKKASSGKWITEELKQSKTSVKISGLKMNTKYTFKIRAYIYYEDDEDWDEEDWDEEDEDWDDEDWDDETYEEDSEDEDWDDEDWDDEEYDEFDDYEYGEYSKMSLKTLSKDGKGNKQAVSDTYEQKAPKTVKKTSVKKLKSSGGKVDITWKKSNKATGYEVYMSTNKNSSFKCIKKIKNAGTLKYTKRGLKKGQKYYFKVRAYVKTGSTVSYTDYSKVKSVKVK